MLQKIKQKAVNHFINIPGWRTNRKIVVIESDDWGSIRMPSKQTFDWFLQNGYNVDQCPYSQNDTLESNEDLELLFDILSSVKDKNNNSAVITANNIVANPDFKKIKNSNFEKYYFESFPETLKRYPDRDRVVNLYRQGIDQNLFRPQFHGREHLNINRWMDGLNAGSEKLLEAFEHKMFTVHECGKINGRRDFLDAFGVNGNQRWEEIKQVIITGLNLFEKLWGYRSKTFIAPCYTWSERVEGILAKNCVEYIQGTHVQRIPIEDKEYKIKKKYHYLGQKNQFGQRYLVRNVNFEPTEEGGFNALDRAKNEINIAFKYQKPAIISSHRVNYIGSIQPENRDQNLKLLQKLLYHIIETYPEVEFMSSDKLGDLITVGR